MNETLKKPVFVFDGQCGFCRLWVDHWRRRVGEAAEFTAFQQASGRFPGIPVERFREAAHLIIPDGAVFRGAEAVYRLVAMPPGAGKLLWCYRRLPGFAAISESVYRWVAAHRPLASRLTNLLVRVNVCRPG